MSAVTTQERILAVGIDLQEETVIAGRVVDDCGHTVAEAISSATGDFRFYAAPGTWTVRALSRVGQGDVTVAPAGAGIHEVDVKVA